VRRLRKRVDETVNFSDRKKGRRVQPHGLHTVDSVTVLFCRGDGDTLQRLLYQCHIVTSSQRSKAFDGHVHKIIAVTPYGIRTHYDTKLSERQSRGVRKSESCLMLPAENAVSKCGKERHNGDEKRRKDLERREKVQTKSRG
jgi:hypothetical protein